MEKFSSMDFVSLSLRVDVMQKMEVTTTQVLREMIVCNHLLS
jgi:hypothetical protein